MTEDILYFLFSIQLYVIVSKLLLKAVNFMQPVYVILISIGITAFFVFILFVARLGNLFMFLLILFANFIIIHFGIFYNIIPPIALYFYIISILKERSLLSTKRALFLSPIILLGIIPLKWKGVFESGLGDKIHSFLYATGTSTAPSFKGNGTAIVSSGSIRQSTEVVVQGIKETFHKIPSFQVLLILLILIVVLMIFLLLLVGFYKSVKKTVFYKKMITSIAAGIGVIAIVSIIFFKFFVKFYRGTLSSMLIKETPGGTFPKIPQGTVDIKSVVHRMVGSSEFLQFARNFFTSAGIIFGIVAIVLGILLAYMLYKFLFNDQIPETVLQGKTVQRFKKQIREKGIEKSLEEIEDPEEFVKFLYFSALYLLKKKSFSMKKYETPDEFYRRLSSQASTAVPHLATLTALFDKVKYSNDKISNKDIAPLRAHYTALLDGIKNIEFKEEVLKGRNSRKEDT